MELSEAVADVYAAPLADFVATRTRWVTAAKDEGDADLAAAIKALRKPTVPAHLVNVVAREEPQVVAALLALGERMRAAQASGDGAALAAARPERRECIDAFVAAAGRAAHEHGLGWSAGVQDSVAATAVAALADEASGTAVASGQLLRPLAYAGFGEVMLDDAVATPLRLLPPLPDDPGDDAEEVSAAERAHQQALETARDRLRDVERELAAARLAESEARAALVAARDRTKDLETRVAREADEVARLETRPGAGRARQRPGSAGS